MRTRTNCSSADKSPENCRCIVTGLQDIGFSFSAELEAQIIQGKDLVQLKNGPFDLDLIFAPDGIERFDDAWKRRIDVEGFPVCHIDDIIASKTASNRKKDLESLPRLESFRQYWRQHNRR